MTKKQGCLEKIEQRYDKNQGYLEKKIEGRRDKNRGWQEKIKQSYEKN